MTLGTIIYDIGRGIGKALQIVGGWDR